MTDRNAGPRAAGGGGGRAARGGGGARPPPPRAMRPRALILFVFFACALLALIGRLAYVQVVKHEELFRLAERQRSKTITLRPKRGPILDRHGEPLAVSSHAESVFALPGRVDGPGGPGRRLARPLP